MRLQGRRAERQTPPSLMRQTKAKKATEQRDRLKEADGRETEGKRGGGTGEGVGDAERELVSQKVRKKQVEKRGREWSTHPAIGN